MANVFAVHSVGASLATFLTNTYPASLKGDFPCDFKVVSTGELAGREKDLDGIVSIVLYRITANEHLRTARRGNVAHDASIPLSVDLHFLLSAWSSSAAAEQVILTWVMQQLHLRPVLDASSLSPEGGWTPGDAIQIVPAELSNEDMMRVWDALEPAYRLSVSYIARVVRIEGPAVPAPPPVVATRFVYGPPEPVR
jgi:hypothetical protein